MPLTPEQQQELAELRRLEELESKYGQQPAQTDPYVESVRNPKAMQPGELLAQQKQMLSGGEIPQPMQIGAEAGMGNLANAAGEPLARLAKFLGKGVTRGGDMLMQKAVGMKRYMPGVGETLANEGVIGTKGMMRGQVERALESTGQRLGSLAESVPEVSTKPVAERLGSRAAGMISEEGTILPEQAREVKAYIDAANKASSEGAISGKEAAFRRIQSGRVAKNAGRYRDNPAQGLKAQLAGEQQSAYSQALKDAPGASPELTTASKTYGDLAQVDNAMVKPESLGSMDLLGKLIPTSLAESAGGRAAIGLGKGINALQTPARAFPATLEELLGKRRE